MSDGTGSPVSSPPVSSPPANSRMQRSGAMRALYVAAHVARILLGLIFVVAAALKGLDPAEFAHQMAGYGIVGPAVSGLSTPLLIAFEFTLGVALLAGFRPRASALTAVALLVAFIGIEAYGIAQGRTEACGCFGAYVQRTPQQVILEDLLFIGFGLLSLFGLRTWAGARGRRSVVAVFAGGLLMLGFAIASPFLPLDPLVTSLAVGHGMQDLGLAETVPDLLQGRHLVALIDVTDEKASETSARLDEIAAMTGGPDVIALTPATEEERLAFTWTAAPAYDLRNLDRPVLKRLYRRLPRFFLVDGGHVQAIFDSAVPVPEDLVSSGSP